MASHIVGALPRNTAFASFEQSMNAAAPMLVTLPGIVTLVKLSQEENA